MLLNDNDGSVAVCHNLRPASGCEGLEPISATERASACRLHVFCEFGADGLSFVAADNKDLSILYPQRATNMVRFIGKVPETPLDINFIDNVVVVTTEKGDYYLDYDPATDLFSHRGYDAGMPDVSIEAAEAAVVSVTVPAAQLSKTASPGRSLTKADAARLSADLVNGYASLLQSAEFSGGQLQPGVGFYRILDADNNEIYRSAPTLVSLPSGVQLTDGIRLKATDTTFTSVESYRLEASVMKMRVNIAAPVGREGARAARLEVWLSPQLHPFDPSRSPDCRLLSRSTTADFASLFLPGLSSPTSIATGAGRRMVDALIAASTCEDFHTVFRRVAVFDRPFDSPGIHDVAAIGADVNSDVATLRAVLSRRIAPCTRLEALAGGGHTVVAALSAEAADVRLGTDLRVTLSDAISPRRFAVKSAAAPWQSVVTVEFADGTVLSRSFSGSTAAPTHFSPIVAYPDPAAVALSVTLQGQGATRMRRFDLAPDPSGRYAAWVAPDFLPVMLEESTAGMTMPPSTVTTVRFRDALMLSGLRTRRALATLRCPGVDIVRILPAVAAAGAWDYGRARFFLFSHQGIFTATTSAARSALTLNILDRRPVVDGRAVAEIDGGRVAAVAGGDLVEVSRAKVTTRKPAVGFDRLGWHPLRRELWCFPPQGDARIFFPGRDWRYATADLGNPSALFPSRSVGLVLTGDDGVSLAEPRGERGVRPVAWRAKARFGGAVVPTYVKVDAVASEVDAVVDVAHGHMSGVEAAMVSFALRGRVGAPLCRRVFCRAVENLEVGLHGTVSSDFLFYAPEIVSCSNGKQTRHKCPA